MYDKNFNDYVHVPAIGSSEDILGKLKNNQIYIKESELICILTRIGYLYNVDDKLKTFNVKQYDFNAEKELVCKKFPVEKFGYGIYKYPSGKDFEGAYLRHIMIMIKYLKYILMKMYFAIRLQHPCF